MFDRMLSLRVRELGQALLELGVGRDADLREDPHGQDYHLGGREQ